MPHFNHVTSLDFRMVRHELHTMVGHVQTCSTFILEITGLVYSLETEQRVNKEGIKTT